ncbi:MAG: hypothetical protein ACYCTV_09520 [Leptospirales bacterium]
MLRNGAQFVHSETPEKGAGTFRSEDTPGSLPSSSRMKYSPLSHHPEIAMPLEVKQPILLRVKARLIRMSSKIICAGGFFSFGPVFFSCSAANLYKDNKGINEILQVNGHGNLTKDAKIGSNPFRRILDWRFDNKLKSLADQLLNAFTISGDYSCP